MALTGVQPRTARTRALRRALLVSVAFVLCYVVSRSAQSLSWKPSSGPTLITRHLLQSEEFPDEEETQTTPSSNTTNSTERNETSGSDAKSPKEPSSPSSPHVTGPSKNSANKEGKAAKPTGTKSHEPKPETVEDKPKAVNRTNPVLRPKLKNVGEKLKGKIAAKQGKQQNVSPTSSTKAATEATATGNNNEVSTSPSNTTEKSEEENCIPPAYKEFPPDLMSHDVRARGGVWVHILVVLYMFYALAVVCDDYFVASLEECCSRLNLSKDVAGATFMAAGSSAPELFTAILGVLIAKGDVGTGTIVGSAVFNVLFVIGICGLFAGKEVPVTWWPLFRDSIFYAFSVVVLILVIFDGEVTWYESFIMLLLYGVYIALMKYNSAIHRWIATTFGIQETDLQPAMGLTAAGYDNKNYSSYVPFNNEIDDISRQSSVPARPLDEVIRDLKRRPTLYEAALRMLMTGSFRPKTRFWAAAKRVTHEYKTIRRGSMRQLPSQTSIDPSDFARYGKSNSVDIALSSDAEWRKIPRLHDGVLSICKWILQAPLLATLHYTVPDCRTAAGKKLFIVSFLMSIFWTAAFSYVMVWMVTLIGYTMGIPDSIMGITFLAAGTSIPDAFASLLVAKQGQGDMAIANSIGSNVFDILIGLALPWLIQTGMIEPGSLAYINSGGLVWSVVLLFLTIIITIYSIHRSLWLLTPRLGVFLLVVYVIFLIFCSAVEFNLLGFVNPPMCDE